MDVLEPVGRCHGTVVTVHGMSPVAERDPRMCAVNASLASVGFRVVSPHVPSIAALRIHAGQIDTLESAFAAVADDSGLAPTGRISVLAVSFSAGLSLVAAARPSVRERIDAVCAIGAYGDIRTTLEAVLTRSDMTTYAWKIVLANFLDAALGERPAVRDALLLSALDEWHKRAPLLPARLRALEAEDAALVREILASPDARRALVGRILAARPRMLDAASVVDHAGALRTSVTLVHGRDDRTLPAAESRRLHEALRWADVPSRLCVTPLISHGDATFAPSALAALPALVAAFQGFFEDASRPAAGGERRLAA